MHHDLLLPLQALGESLEVGWLTGVLLGIVRGGAEWVLWLLVILSLVSIAVMIERWWFYRSHRANTLRLREIVVTGIEKGEPKGALKELDAVGDSMEANVLSYGFQHLGKGARAVEELMAGAMARERARYDRFLAFLATLGNNAPFVGLFGTVLGIINAFDNLRGLDAEGAASAGAEVMGPLAEALIATGVGILVAIPAVAAFNYFKERVKLSVSNTELLARTMVGFIIGEEEQGRGGAKASSGK
jgi:biopolymer transport protein ExbB/TolQ